MKRVINRTIMVTVFCVLVVHGVAKMPMKETLVQSLIWEDLLQKEMATCLSILAWEIPWTEKPGMLQSIGL